MIRVEARPERNIAAEKARIAIYAACLAHEMGAIGKLLVRLDRPLTWEQRELCRLKKEWRELQ